MYHHLKIHYLNYFPSHQRYLILQYQCRRRSWPKCVKKQWKTSEYSRCQCHIQALFGSSQATETQTFPRKWEGQEPSSDRLAETTAGWRMNLPIHSSGIQKGSKTFRIDEITRIRLVLLCLLMDELSRNELEKTIWVKTSILVSAGEGVKILDLLAEVES